MAFNKKSRISLKDITITAFFTALISLFSQIAVYIGPIPINFGLLAAFLGAGLLGFRNSLSSVIAFIFLGAIGIPVFAGFSGGLGRLFGPTGGYILGYLPAVAVISILLYKLGKTSLTLCVAMSAGLLITYLCGTVWYVLISDSADTVYSAVTACVLPFIPGDLLKIVTAVILCRRLEKPLKNFYNNR